MDSTATTADAPIPGDLSALSFETEYRSLKDDPVRAFYRPCLMNSGLYQRAVGYFRSSVFAVVGPAVLEFARRGGRIELICSPELDADDIDSIALGYAHRSELVADALIRQFDQLLGDAHTAIPARILATLVALERLEIKLAVRMDRKGLYHEKLGVFSDSLGNRVSFKGSANETWSGWHEHGNFESIEVFCSWRGGLEAKRVERHQAHFRSLWSEKDRDVEVFAFPATATEHLKRASMGRLEDLSSIATVSAPAKRSALPHQDAAIAAWEARGSRGIFEHATGSGKTFTAILAIRNQVERKQPVIVLVPSRLLLEQWAMELREEVPGAALLLAGGGHSRWRSSSRLQGMTAPDGAMGRIVLATMQTAATDRFRSNIVEGAHLLVVADEVHQIGSLYNSRFLEVDAGKRLGLSATPTRYGDPEGTRKILDYFGDVVPPPITLNDAIRAGRLVEYEYYPHPINLTASEAEEWRTISAAIRQEMARQKEDERGRRPLSERAKMLLIKRSRIAKKAAKKVDLARQIMQDRYEDGQHWLIYCEDSHQLGQVRDALAADGHSPVEYHSSMEADRDTTMAWFKAFGGPMVSIRCLDEGVDIPAVSHALILASSQNPRQFIQRRGRVLRTAPGKHLAVIHDAIVVPISLESEPDQTSLLKAELLRSIEFAENAINKMAGAELRDIAATLGYEPGERVDAGIEEGDDDAE